jgi:hypothetical protein
MKSAVYVRYRFHDHLLNLVQFLKSSKHASSCWELFKTRLASRAHLRYKRQIQTTRQSRPSENASKRQKRQWDENSPVDSISRDSISRTFFFFFFNHDDISPVRLEQSRLGFLFYYFFKRVRSLFIFVYLGFIFSRLYASIWFICL